MTRVEPPAGAFAKLRSWLAEDGVAGAARNVGSYIQWRLTRRKTEDERDRQLRALREEAWMPILERAQSVVWSAGDDYYRTVYQSHEIHYWTNIARWLYELSQTRQEVRAVDVGCGFGTVAVYMNLLFDRPSFASDMHRRDSLDLMEQQGYLTFRRCNIELDPFPFEGPFDVIVFTEILEHLNFDPVPTLLKLRDVLADDGRVLLSTPDAASWGRVTSYYKSPGDMPTPEEGKALMAAGEWDYIDDHVWQYSWDELQAVLDRAGLKVIRSEHAPGVGHAHFNLELSRA